MGRIINLVLVLAMAIGAAVTYQMKHKAEMAADHVARLEANIAKEREAITMRRAEVSMLTQPPRLQAVVERFADHFKLAPFTPAQSISIDEIPLKPVEPDPTASKEAMAGVMPKNAIQ